MANTSISSLAILPTDCWLGILENLSSKDYYSLLFVCKDISSSVESLLFRKIAWEWRPTPLRRILLLFRAIVQKPKRASDIRQLSLLSHEEVDLTEDWEPPSCDTDSGEEVAKFKDVLQHAQAIIESARFPDADTWKLALESGNPYAFVSVFLSQLENLQSLRLDYSFVWQSGFPGLMLRHALSSSTLSHFQSLTDVDYGANICRDRISFGIPEIYNDPGYPECNPEQFAAWFYLPALRSLKIWLQTKKGIELPGRRPDLSRLKRLILARTTIQEAQIPDILSLTQNLETLHLGMAYRWGKETALQDGPSILQGLDFVRESLTNLSFGIEYFPPTNCDVWLGDGEDKLSIPFYGFLKRFPNLRAIEVPVNLLSGWSSDTSSDLTLGLPDRVEQLCLRGDYQAVDLNEWEDHQVLHLIANNAATLRSHMPGLRQICMRTWCQLWSPWVSAVDEKLKAARSACTQEQIHFEVVSDDISNGLWTETRTCPEREVY
ncbi:hypothetical protein BDV18DRAFT_106614 [Aspergillus unguis]